MVVWIFVLFAVTLSLSTFQVAAFSIRADAEVIIKIPDECKGQRDCAIKPEHLEGKINSSDHADEAESPGLQRRKRSRERREPELAKHNCLEEVKYEARYKYLDEKSDDNNFEIIAQSPYLRELIEVTQCRVLPPPLTNDSNEQCFTDLHINDFGLKSYCVTKNTRSTIYFYNEDKTVMYRKVINVPVACSCMVSYASEPYS